MWRIKYSNLAFKGYQTRRSRHQTYRSRISAEFLARGKNCWLSWMVNIFVRGVCKGLGCICKQLSSVELCANIFVELAESFFPFFDARVRIPCAVLMRICWILLRRALAGSQKTVIKEVFAGFECENFSIFLENFKAVIRTWKGSFLFGNLVRTAWLCRILLIRLLTCLLRNMPIVDEPDATHRL